jgi:hypothetical protein
MPRKVLAIVGAEDGEVVGYEGNGVVVLRGDNERLDQCRERAFGLTGSATLTTLYREEGQKAAQERELAQSRRPTALEASEALSGLENRPIDPFALAGIGREATLEELWQSGAIRGPWERLR